ncbi:toll/interleukin-1 receptor domain-containing protein [candidate division KSB1 bacterium]|nr:toll/interleukin-1 receptor domain-containing protein [candidate division KSB1 bacterium]
MKNNKNHIFLSYKSDHVNLVRRVAERLKSEQISVWMDEYGLRHDQLEIFQRIINEAIDDSGWWVLFVSKHYIESDYCLIEAQRIREKRSPEKVIVFFLEESESFRSIFPELLVNCYSIKDDAGEIFRILQRHGVISKLIEPIQLDVSEEVHQWQVMEAGFEFNNFNWAIVPGSRFHLAAMNRSHMLSYSGVFRTDFHEFRRSLNGLDVSLFLDYDIFNEFDADYIKSKILSGEFDPVRIKKFDDDDRLRHKEELRRFGFEVKNAYKRITMNTDLYKMMQNKMLNTDPEPVLPEIEEIGIHLFSTVDRNVEFKHRLFTFRIPAMGKIYRVYKLVLPHPLFDITFRVRFIFSFEDNFTQFYKSIPYCDSLVNSFRWISDKKYENLDKNKILDARKIILGDG